MPGRLEDRVAVVTGAGRGAGKAIALALAAEGASVVVNDGPWGELSTTDAASGTAAGVVEEICNNGGIAVAQTDSVTTKEGGEAIIQTAIDNFGRIDILVNNAAATSDRMLWNMDEKQWDLVLGVTLKGVFNCARPAAARMKWQRYGRILAMTSSAALLGNSGACNNAAAKAGLIGFMNGIARDLGYYGVTANTISPGVRRDEAARSGGTEGHSALPYLRTIADHQAKYGARRLFLGVGATGVESAAHIAPLVVFLASERAANVNGQVIGVRGEIIELWKPNDVARIISDRHGKWSGDVLCRYMPATMADVFNFAPAPQ